MAYQYDKETGDIIINGFEQGIAPSPHKGIANLQNVNISTETGEVISSFVRVQETLTNTSATGSLTFVDSSHVELSIANTNNLFKGNWITVTASSNTTQLPNGTYYVAPSTGANFQLSNFYNVVNYLPQIATYLVVAGGGGGGAGNGGGGGGGGGLLTGTTNLTAGTFAVTVGTGGGGGGTNLPGTDGNNSVFSSFTAIGGGGGGNGGGGANPGLNGGSGGGGGAGGSSGLGGTGTVGQGNNGGAGRTTATISSGGGGGAGTAGSAGTASVTGAGGSGLSNSTSGVAVLYGGGGGGGGTASGVTTGGTAGTGGGGAGGSSTTSGTNGTVGSGGGGGGGGNNGGNVGGNGGSGVVIISYPTNSIIGATGGVITTTIINGVSYNVHTFTTSGNFVIPTVQTVLNTFSAGLTASFTMVATMGKPLASATETYLNVGTVYNRYYILDNQNLVWVYDTINETLYSSTDNVMWFLPDTSTAYCTNASGIAVISGFLMVTASNGIFAKSVVTLGNTNSTATTWVQMPDATGWAGIGSPSSVIHFAYVGHQGNMYVTDGSYIANLEPISTISDATGASSAQNVQSFCNWTVNSQFIANYSVISGTSANPSDFPKRVPAVFFVLNGGVLPTAIAPNTVYYINANDSVFQVYSASSGGSALDIQTGALGVQYFNTFYPISANTESTASTPLYYYQNQRLALPVFEIAQCMAEIGNTIVIGCRSNTLYPWDQIQNLPANIISLPESNTVNIITVHQMGYVFTGNKGNIYLTDGNIASAVTTIPDYTAGVPGTPSSYIEPVFNWGGAMYLRGRVYFSLLDQTATKAGNCGGIWSLVPTQNLYIGQDIGIGLRLENQNSYGTYNGVATVLIPKVNQNAIAPQYFSGWENSITNPIYGIDATGTTFSPTAVVESDGIPTGTMFDKKTFKQIEFKLSSPLLTGDTVTLFYRKNLTEVWVSCGAVQLQEDKFSGYVSANFEKSQWLQLRTLLNASASFIRLFEIRIR